MPHHREPTLADVAERAGVSLTTVSRVLNNRGYLSQATRSCVAEAIKELGYRPNQVARALHGKSTHSIGIIVPTVALPFFGELSSEIEDALAEHGYRTLICNSLDRRDREHDYLDLLVSHRVDGIISGAHNEDLSEYRSIHKPLVAVDRDLSPIVPNVRCANEDSARQATEHLLARGARRPALLTSRTGAHNRREAGYRAVLEEAGIEPVIIAIDFHTPDERRAQMIREGLDALRDQVDAVFATDDLSAADALEWAHARGLDVPGEFKVVGFDGTAALRRALPGLTTVQQPIRAIARTAVDLLLEQITALRDDDERPRPAHQVIELPGTLLQGRTT
ncbi:MULTISPECIES: LacI family DNA-binding transcriptional regulator [Actinomyces]|uniref:LacI family DNA-binding transcriptional regulator n=1 Tax=Actinomyces respiraculi TaxID=2744574 RepID=A0A7T0PUR1_9ACTO|nr:MULTISPECIES: LacI family DNA-binding transcriptional regulator [Actinomyces]QPL04446.1 LacI family DNA-binding transcriptional regulator [Actinomyces respiraculi]